MDKKNYWMAFSYFYLWVVFFLLIFKIYGEDKNPFTIPPKVCSPNYRELYNGLSDSEFASLFPGPVSYPIVVPLFLERPLTGNDFEYSVPFYGKDEDIQLQVEVLNSAKDMNFRALIIGELVRTRHPKVPELLFQSLKTESDTKNLATLLLGLSHFTFSMDSHLLQSYLQHQDEDIQLAAARLWSQQAYSYSDILLQKAKGPRRIEWIQFAAKCKKDNNLEFWNNLLKEKDPCLAPIIGSVLAQHYPHSLNDDLIHGFLKEKDPLYRLALIQISPYLSRNQRLSLWNQLKQDEHDMIRMELARIIGQMKDPESEPILLDLLTDLKSFVRLTAIEGSHFLSSKKLFEKLMENLKEKQSDLLWEATWKRLVGLSRESPVEEWISSYLTYNDDKVRRGIYRFLATIQSHRYGDWLTQQLKQEKEPATFSAGIIATAIAKGNLEEWFIEQAHHESSLVRGAVAQALGILSSRKGVPTLIQMINKDKDGDVRWEAFIALGKIKDAQAGSICLEALKRVNLNDYFTSRDRSAACWVASHLDQVSHELIQRMYRHVSSPVIPMPGMPPAYDLPEVRVSATLAILILGHRFNNQEWIKLGNACLQILNTPPEALVGTNSTMPVGPDLQAYADQIQRFIKGEPLIHHRVEPRKWEFSYQSLQADFH